MRKCPECQHDLVLNYNDNGKLICSGCGLAFYAPAGLENDPSYKQMYLMSQARAHENRGDKEQAIKYYNMVYNTDVSNTNSTHLDAALSIARIITDNYKNLNITSPDEIKTLKILYETLQRLYLLKAECFKVTLSFQKDFQSEYRKFIRYTKNFREHQLMSIGVRSLLPILVFAYGFLSTLSGVFIFGTGKGNMFTGMENLIIGGVLLFLTITFFRVLTSIGNIVILLKKYSSPYEITV